MDAKRYGILVGIFASLLVVGLWSYTYLAQAQKQGERAIAQERDEDRRPPHPPRFPIQLSDEDVERLGRVLEVYSLQEEIGLSEEQLLQVLPRWRELRAKRDGFFSKRGERLDALEALLNRKDNPPTPEEFEAAYQEYTAADEQFWSEYIQEREEIIRLLSPEQKVRYLIFENRTQRDLGRLYRALKEIQRFGERDEEKKR